MNTDWKEFDLLKQFGIKKSKHNTKLNESKSLAVQVQPINIHYISK